MTVSIILTTRNRANDLEQTLNALRVVDVPDSLDAELLVVDNGSQDHTREVVARASHPRIRIRYTREEQPGQSRARNRGLAETAGELVVFVDDDVRPSSDWLTNLCAPLLDRGPCAVSGGVALAAHLQRPWMTKLHRSWLAATEWLDPENPASMVGANMAFSRDVLRRVPAFDVELGPGASGFSDDHLFASQLRAAGFKIHASTDASVEHHFSPQRLTRGSWLDAAVRRGASHAYCGHHWEHWRSRLVGPRWLQAVLKLNLWRKQHPGYASAEGCSEAELELLYRCALLRGHLREKSRPRSYDFHGLVKRSSRGHGEPTGRVDVPCASAA